MRDLTDEELAKKPDGLDFYIVVGDKVYFTDVFGIDVYCAETGEFVDGSVINGLWKSAKKINPKPFDISEYVFSDNDLICEIEKGYVRFKSQTESDESVFDKKDVIALAKHFKLTAEDLK